MQDDRYNCLFQKTLKKRNKKGLAWVLSYQHIVLAKYVCIGL